MFKWLLLHDLGTLFENEVEWGQENFISCRWVGSSSAFLLHKLGLRIDIENNYQLKFE